MTPRFRLPGARAARAALPPRARAALRTALGAVGERVERLPGSAGPRTVARLVAWDTVEVSGAGERRRRVRLDDPAATVAVTSRTLVLEAPDPAGLRRLATCGLLTGRVRAVRGRVAWAPPWLRAGLRLPPTAWDAGVVRWRVDGDGVDVVLGWRNDRDAAEALAALMAATSRSRVWDQAGGQLPALDRRSWLDGSGTWPQGMLVARSPADDASADGPTGPLDVLRVAPADPWTLVTGVAFPYRRRLVGTPPRHRLQRAPDGLAIRDSRGRELLRLRRSASPERGVAASTLPRYALVEVDPAVGDEPFGRLALLALAATGSVLWSPDPGTANRLRAGGLAVTDSPEVVTGLEGYAWSVESARRAVVEGDASLRRTALGSAGGGLSLPAVSALVASKRSEEIETCLTDLATQTYPELEVLVGTHGYAPEEPTRRRWQEIVGRHPLRVVPASTGTTLGQLLGRLSRLADGDFLAKVDDDDRYGPDHVTDLLLARHCSGADLVAKGARFVHLPHEGQTVDREWAAPEVHHGFAAGGGMLLARSTVLRVGGWSTSVRHVDADLIARVRAAGGVTYRTHGLGYVYVRTSAGHTWDTSVEAMRAQGEALYAGLPRTLVEARPSGTRKA